MSRRLLLADDSVTIQKVIEITLSDKDYILRVASDGDEALRLANTEKPDLIMADVFMPGKNGYEVCEAIRSTPALQNVPVLLLAGTFEPFDQDKAQSVGANGWIVKPFSSQALIDKVEELLALVPAKEQWQATPSTAPGDQDILQALEEVTASQAAAESAASAIAPAFEQPVDFEPESFEPAVAAEPATTDVELEPFSFAVEEEASELEVSADPFAATAEPAETADAPAQELEPFVGFDLPEDREPTASAEPEPFEEFSTQAEPFDFAQPDFTADTASDSDSFAAQEELEPTQLGEELEDFSFNEEPAPAPSPAIAAVADSDTDFDSFSFHSEPEPAVAAEPPADLPPLGDFQVPGAVAAPVGAVAAVPADNVVNLREEDIVAEGAYASEPARVEKRVAFLSDEQLTEIVERVAGAVIERLATPLLEKVIWEVVPDLAESMVREEMAKIKSDAE